ncbi:hypothetical protein AVEN_182916-1 [Araneus ventricosus]|uniref:Uncharacterized protein n=1 Tax=Araneus ventricosus TaxID=182803 RepID=A0A4Y2DKH3_ARAVE|nr:hypothetical protein AVEN_102777-1 [Araneus ventricosus]GBM17234.1 hypothetical protein AVEN_69788-1 [Araneus ventricosus]GBM17251.1 hypothetical protein AVEN_116928-1 [Araneus ventricosus]GBM17273.1 hypothetical protein AVEN_182916-1 [Araneus ventricosus]
MLQHIGKKKASTAVEQKSDQRMLKLRKKNFEAQKIIDSKPRSPSCYTFCRNTCDAEVIGIICLKSTWQSLQFISRKHDWNTKQQLVTTGIQKREGDITSHQFFTSPSHLAERKKKKARVFHLVAIHALLRKNLF